MKKLWKNLIDALAEHAPEILETLQPGATQAEIKALEQHLGVTLPDDYRAFLELCNGASEDAEYGFYDGELLSVSSIKFQWGIWQKLLQDGTFEGTKSRPGKGVRGDWWNSKWIPFTHDGGGNHLCLDLDPAPGGHVGQVITMWHDTQERELMYPSFMAWLEHILAGLESGEIVLDTEEYMELIDAADLE